MNFGIFTVPNFLDAVSDERMTLGPIDEEGIREMQERYEALEPSDKKIVEEEEDKLLSTMIYNFAAYMMMMEVHKIKDSPFW